MSTLYIDVTEFIGNPILTGIQRIVRELLTHWPSEVDYVLVRYDPAADRLRRLHRDAARHAIDLARQDHLDMPRALEEIDYRDRHADRRPVSLQPGDRLLAPELFFEHARVAFYRRTVRAGVEVFLIVPDFLVWLRPDTFPIPGTSPLMPYLELLLECHARAFISRAVMRTFSERISRRPPYERDIAIDLGADGLGLDRQVFDPGKKVLVCLGTLDGRKGQDLVYRAFCERQRGEDLRLLVIGRRPPQVAACLADLLANERPDVELFSGASDSEVVDRLRSVRALLYPSPSEGFGLPPVESLHAGIPVVVHRDLPALEGRPPDGQIRLPQASPDTIRAAIETLADDATAQALWEGAARFPSITWEQSTRQVAEWVAAHIAGPADADDDTGRAEVADPGPSPVAALETDAA